MLKRINFTGILYYAASFLLPGVFLFFLYTQNVAANFLRLEHALIVAAILGLAGLVGFVLLRLISKNKGMAIALSAFVWIFFWFFEGIAAPLNAVGRLAAIVVVAVVVLGAALTTRLIKINLSKIQIVFTALAGVICLLFVINFGGAIWAGRSGPAPDMQFENSTEPTFYVRRDFYVSPHLPTPDVYWIHLDGMVSLSTFERFWGENQDHVRHELASRGFVIDEGAYLRNAAGTHVAVPMLLSPAFYDNYLGIILNALDEGFGEDVRWQLNAILAADEVCLYYDVATHFELLNAFLAAGYYVQGTTDWWPLVDPDHMSGDHTHLTRFRQAWNAFMRTDMPQMLSATTPLNFEAIHKMVWGDAALLTATQNDHMPTLTWIYYENTHGWFWFSYCPSFDGRHGYEAEKILDLYPIGWELIIANVLTAIDEILNRNPDAVIVLQSDHGLHRRTTQQHMVDIGLPHDVSMELIHSVFSAVRIPNAFGGLDAPIAPINIARELVNRFVGPNYDMATPHINPFNP